MTDIIRITEEDAQEQAEEDFGRQLSSREMNNVRRIIRRDCVNHAQNAIDEVCWRTRMDI